MCKRIWLSSIVIVTLLVGVSSGAFAETSGDGPQHGKGKKGCWEERRNEMYKDLGLTDAQKKALEANKNSSREQAKAFFKTMHDKMEAMRQELEKSTLDMARINQIQGELKSVQAQLEDHRLAGILEVRKVLTPEQFKKFMSKMGERKGHFGKGGGPREGGCPPDKE